MALGKKKKKGKNSFLYFAAEHVAAAAPNPCVSNAPLCKLFLSFPCAKKASCWDFFLLKMYKKFCSTSMLTEQNMYLI